MSDSSTTATVRGAGLPVVACDLDRTLIYSAKALHLTGPDAEAPRLVVSEVYEGRPLSYMTGAAEALLHELLVHAFLVPVTTRTRAQFERVRLPPSRYAITTNGGVLLQDGVADHDWSERVAASVAEGSAPLPEIAERIGAGAARGVQRVRDAEGLFVYAIVERDELQDGYVEELSAWCAARGWVVSLQGRKLYCVPAAVTKEAAVAEVKRRAGASQLIAAGDSLLDRGLLESADLALRPCHGELEAVGYRRQGLIVTERPGVLAGEEILSRALAVVQT